MQEISQNASYILQEPQCIRRLMSLGKASSVPAKRQHTDMQVSECFSVTFALTGSCYFSPYFFIFLYNVAGLIFSNAADCSL